MTQTCDESKLLPLSQLAKQLPAVRGEKPPHRITLYKWATVGLQNRAGQRFRLPTQFIGGTRCASLADVRRFFEVKGADDWQPQQRLPMTQKELAAMRRRAEAACERLKQSGW